MFFRSLGTTAFVSLLPLLASSCSSNERNEHSVDSAARDTSTPSIRGSVGHRDPRLGAPSFVWLNEGRSFASAVDAATSVVPSVLRGFEVSEEVGAGLSLLHVDDTSKGPIVARYAQHVRNIEVFRGSVNVALTRSFRPIAASGFVAPTARGSERAFVLDATSALAVAARTVGAKASFSSLGEKGGYERFRGEGLRLPARAKRVFYPVRGADGVELEPAWYVELRIANGPARSWIVSAMNGRVLLDNDLVRHDAFSYRVYADPETKVPNDGPQGNGFAPHPAGKPDKRKLTVESSQTVTIQNFPFSKNDPWLSPDATTTSGNNVVAYADLQSPDGFDPGVDVAPTFTSPKTFGSVFDTSASPAATPASIQAAATHLFYVTNFLHDWFYDAGYDEASGNHQLDNFGRGGQGDDPLLAEAQDYSGRNNANAEVPPDGSSPRVQMFVFSGASEASLVVSAPASMAGTKTVGIASGFGEDTFDVTGSVVLASDGTGDVADACESLDGTASGKIVLVHRGTCSFAQKAAAAQDAGAIGIVIANVAASADAAVAPFMGGQQNGITIPVLSLSLPDGQAIEGALSAGVTVTMKRSVGSDLDGALDTSIVAHEWGHVLSGRLIGDGMGLTTNQAGGLGEGWGDFTALLLTVRPDDPGQFGGTYANGLYATSGSGDDIYFGTRRVPYSIDFTKNALTLKHIQNGEPLPSNVVTSFGEDGSFNSEVHNTGEVWATMLWECYASLLRDRGLSFQEAQDRMKRYLVASLKLTPSDPTILEARDAVLAAAYAGDEKDFQLFWKAFARRGAGAGATGPGKESSTNQGVTESYESGNAIEIVGTKLSDDVVSCDHDGILDDGEIGTLEVSVRNSGSGTLASASAQVFSKTEGLILDTAPTPLNPLKPFESTTIKVAVRVKAGKQAEPIELDVVVSDPSLPDGRVVHALVESRYDADEAPAVSATDHVDTTKTVWKVTSTGPGDKWSRSTTTGDGYWTIPDPLESTADHRLTSPGFTIEGTTFTLAFKHKWNFKRSTRRNVDIDGGVVELSVDAGKTWKDISEYATVDYNTTLDTGDRTGNPIGDRKAYGNKSAGFPDQWVNTRIDVTLPSHPESVHVRFRLGSGLGRTGADGWFVDDIDLVGIASTPFSAYVPQADACDAEGPSANAGPPQVVSSRASVKLAGSATHPANKALTALWTQVAGPAVVLQDESTLTPTFIAPDVTAPTTLTLSLRVHDGVLLSAASRVDILVEPPKVDGDDGGCACRTIPGAGNVGGGASLAVLGVAALFTRRRRRWLNRIRSSGST